MARSGVLFSSMCRSCRQSYNVATHSSLLPRRAISSSSTRLAERHGEGRGGLAQRLGIRVEPENPPSSEPETMDQIAAALRKPQSSPSHSTGPVFSGDLQSIAQSARDEAATRPNARVSADEPYHLNVYAHKHNMHITFTEPSRNPILSFSSGNIGLRKAQRSSYDACFQLAAYTFRKIAEKQWRVGGKKMTHNEMKTFGDIRRPGAMHGGVGIEVIFRGFGPGREAFQKALLGTEGRMIKPLISKVTDGTRLKFGGTRSPQVRRLG